MAFFLVSCFAKSKSKNFVHLTLDFRFSFLLSPKMYTKRSVAVYMWPSIHPSHEQSTNQPKKLKILWLARVCVSCIWLLFGHFEIFRCCILYTHLFLFGDFFLYSLAWILLCLIFRSSLDVSWNNMPTRVLCHTTGHNKMLVNIFWRIVDIFSFRF